MAFVIKQRKLLYCVNIGDLIEMDIEARENWTGNHCVVPARRATLNGAREVLTDNGFLLSMIGHHRPLIFITLLFALFSGERRNMLFLNDCFSIVPPVSFIAPHPS